MAYTLKVWCGCTVSVECSHDSQTGPSRFIKRRSARCRKQEHQVGARLWLWEILPDRHVSRSSSVR